MRKPSRLVLVLACLAFAAPVWGQQSTAEWRFGDVFVAVGGGSYEVFHNSGSTYVSEGNITGSTSGITAGCASDATFHLITTDYAVTDFPNGAVDRWTMNADPTNPPPVHTVVQPLSIPGGEGLSSNPTSVVVDAMGNLYAGTSDGKGLIVEYPLSMGMYGNPITLPLGVSSIGGGGTPYIDLSADGKTMYFANGGPTVKSFLVSSSTISFFFVAPNATTHFYGLRVIPSGSFAGYLLVAAGPKIDLFKPDGTLAKTYTVPNESNFQYLALNPNTAGVTSFWVGNPVTNKFYLLSLNGDGDGDADDVEEGPIPASGPISGICAYGDFHADQAQPMTAAVTTNPATDSFLFKAPQDPTATLKVTFTPAPPGTYQPTDLSGLTVSAVVTAVNLAAGYSDAIQSSTNFPASDNPLACTLDTTPTGLCLVWELDDNTDPTGTPAPPYTAATYAFSQAGVDGNTRLIRDGNSNITELVGNLDPGGQTRGISGYSLNEIRASDTPDSFCGYGSPVGKLTYKFGSAIPFKFSAATSSANCASRTTVTNLMSNFGAPFLLLWQLPAQGIVSAGSPVPNAKVSGQSGVPLVYRPSSGSYIVNLKTNSLTPGACYIATTFADEIPATEVEFCLSSK